MHRLVTNILSFELWFDLLSQLKVCFIHKWCRSLWRHSNITWRTFVRFLLFEQLKTYTCESLFRNLWSFDIVFLSQISPFSSPELNRGRGPLEASLKSLIAVFFPKNSYECFFWTVFLWNMFLSFLLESPSSRDVMIGDGVNVKVKVWSRHGRRTATTYFTLKITLQLKIEQQSNVQKPFCVTFCLHFAYFCQLKPEKI